MFSLSSLIRRSYSSLGSTNQQSNFTKRGRFSLSLLFLLLIKSSFLMAQPEPSPMTLEFDTEKGTGTTIYLPLQGTVNVSVHWGDGITETFTTSGTKSHTYASSGVYTVIITGLGSPGPSLTGFGDATVKNTKLTKVLSFGDLGISNLNFAFVGATNLTAVPAILPTTVTSLYGTFSQASSFNQDLSGWDVSRITNMREMFSLATSFNGNISTWVVGNVTNMDQMFNGATAFNGAIGGWDVSNVTTMGGMFQGASSFNQPIGSWNVGKVIYMSQMFYGASVFNQDISNWTVSNVTTMVSMFENATQFSQNIGGWNISNVSNMQFMFRGATLSTANYDALLTGWSSQVVKPSVTFHGGNSKYSCSAAHARHTLMTNPTTSTVSAIPGWDIIDGGGATICPPFNLTAVPGDGEVTISFTPGSDGGSPITNYEYQLDNGLWVPFSPSVTSSPVKIMGLTNGREYGIKLRAVNAIGESVASEEVRVTPDKTILDYTMTFNGVSGTYDGTPFSNQQLVITFSNVDISNVSLDQNGIYKVLFPNGKNIKVTLGSILTDAPLDDLVSNSNSVAAFSGFIFLGGSDGQQGQCILTSFLNSPDIPSQLTTEWTSDAQFYAMGQSFGPNPPIAWAPIIAGKILTFINSLGNPAGGKWGSVKLKPSTPDAPTGLNVTEKDGSLEISFTPGFDGGSPITKYEYTKDGGANWIAFDPTVTTSPVTIPGLTNGTQYSIQLRAVNAIGNGAASDPVTGTPVAPLSMTFDILCPSTTFNADPTSGFQFSPEQQAILAQVEIASMGGSPSESRLYWFSSTTATQQNIVQDLTALQPGTYYLRFIEADDFVNGKVSAPITVTIFPCESKEVEQEWYIDADGDGFVGELVLQVERPTGGYLLEELAGANKQTGDCDDTDSAINPTTVWYLDADGDGYHTGTGVTACVSPGANYVTTTNGTDCDDTDNTKNASFSFFVDADGDGFGAGTSVSVCAVDANTPPAGYSVNSTDCDDTDATKNASFSFYVDVDGDGFGAGTSVSVCAVDGNTPPAGYSVNSTDCDDTDATKKTSFSFFVDVDGDGFGAGTSVSVCAVDGNTPPAGYSVNSTDCDDTDATKKTSFNFFVDADGDGFGAGTSVSVCAVDANTPPAGYIVNSTDCDDTDATKNASFSFYVDADGDGFGKGNAVTVCAVNANTAPAGYSVNSTDCDDTDATKNASFSFYVDADGDGFGKGNAVTVCAVNANTAPAGYSVNSTDCDDANPNKRSTFGFYLDSDKDGYGAGSLVNICAFDANTPPVGYSTNNTDCAPKDATKWRSAVLFIDADNDGYTCGSKTICYGATIPKGYREVANGMDCNDKNANVNPGKTEICGNKIDDDCDGQVDEGCVVPCSFTTLTQNGWDATGASSPLTNNWFAAKFPAGLTIGGTGNSARFIKLTTAAAVRAMLPSSGIANLLTQCWTNPTNKVVKNIFAGELVALTLNHALHPDLGNAKIKSGPYINKTVSWLLTEANLKISSTTTKSAELKSLSDACSRVNSSFGKTKTGYVACDNVGPSATTTTNEIVIAGNAFEFGTAVDKTEVLVYPNPSTNHFTLKNTYDVVIRARVLSASGQAVELLNQIQPGQTKQFGHNLKGGVYLLEIEENGNRVVKKLMKLN